MTPTPKINPMAPKANVAARLVHPPLKQQQQQQQGAALSIGGPWRCAPSFREPTLSLLSQHTMVIGRSIQRNVFITPECIVVNEMLLNVENRFFEGLIQATQSVQSTFHSQLL